MFTLISGLPGSSKSLQTIKLVEGERIREDGSKREVYYWGIPDLTLDWQPLHADDITADQARAFFDLGVKELVKQREAKDAFGWHEVPTDSIVVIDEAHFVFPPLTQKERAKPPAHYGPLAVHRHSGFDLYCMTQHPSLLAIEARRQVQRHWHLERPFGLDYANRLAWEKCESPDDRGARGRADVARMSLDKKWFGVYRSAEVHTVKKRLPWKKLALAFGSLAAVVVLFIVAFHFLTRGKASPEVAASGVARPVPVEQRTWTAEDMVPQFAAWPWSAPIYRDAVKFVSVPKIVGCMSMRIGERFICKCHNGQGDAGVSGEVCRAFMAGEVFDPTRAVVDAKAENIKRLDEGQRGSGGDPKGDVPDRSGAVPPAPVPRRTEAAGRS